MGYADFFESFLGNTKFIPFLEKKEKELEKSQWIRALLEGLNLSSLAAGKNSVKITLYLRGPEQGDESRNSFVEEIIAWLEGTNTNFLDECILKHRVSGFHSPLERALKKEFDFGLEYKVVVEERGKTT